MKATATGGDGSIPGSGAVSRHYSDGEMPARIADALHRAGLDHGTITWRDLAPLDQFHVRGLAATKELAEGLNPQPGATVLDVGSGLGGPARYLAAEYGCQVTGIDLSQSYVDVAQDLAARAGLTDRAVYQKADALDLPFADATFDYAWTQHVAMNIRDRDGLYRGIHRVLKPGGLLAIYDVVAGDGEPLIYPVPWARTPEISFLLTPDAMRESLSKAGFAEVSWRDTTEPAVTWFEAIQNRLHSPEGLPPLGLHVVLGPEFLEMSANLARNLKDGRVRLIQAIVRRA